MQEKKLSLAALAEMTNSKLAGNPSHEIRNVADLESATKEDASFLANPRYIQAMKKSLAGVVFIDQQTFDQYQDSEKNFLINSNPSGAFQAAVELFHKQRKKPSGFEGIHPTAVVHPTAKIGQGVTLCPHAVIDEEAVIGDGTYIGAGAYIGAETVVGSQCIIHPHVTVREQCLIGNRVILQPGAVIGSCGFGYTTDKEGRHIKLNQVGNVTIEDDVEIGANTTVDRSRFKTTRIGRGSKIDNLVQIAHGVIIGQYNIIVAQTGIAGSTETGKYVVLAGQVAVTGHVKLDDGVVVSACSGVTKSLSKGTYGGLPVMPMEQYNRNRVFVRNLETYVNQIKDLEKRLKIIENNNT